MSPTCQQAEVAREARVHLHPTPKLSASQAQLGELQGGSLCQCAHFPCFVAILGLPSPPGASSHPLLVHQSHTQACREGYHCLLINPLELRRFHITLILERQVSESDWQGQSPHT